MVIKKCAIIQLFILFYFVSFSQEGIKLNGKIKDLYTSQPLSFVTIELLSSHTALISNEEGSFSLSIDSLIKNDTISFSCLGYKTLHITVKQIISNKITNFILVPQIYPVKEIPVFGKRKKVKPEKLVRKAISKISENYSPGPILYKGYYREYLRNEGDYLNLYESIIQLEDPGFGKPDTCRVKILYSRINKDFPHDSIKDQVYDNKFLKFIPGARISPYGGNELMVLRSHDPIRNSKIFTLSFIDKFAKNFIKNHRFELKGVTYIDKLPVYCISFKFVPPVSPEGDTLYNISAEGNIYISSTNYCIQKITYTAYLNDDNHPHTPIYNLNLEYKKKKDWMYLHYISFNNYFEMLDLTDSAYFKIDSVIVDKPNKLIILGMNHEISLQTALNVNNYEVFINDMKLGLEQITIHKNTVQFSISPFHTDFLDSLDNGINRLKVIVKNIRDLNGDLINQRRYLKLRQLREFFINKTYEEYEFDKTGCMDKKIPVSSNKPIYKGFIEEDFVNTPLKE